MPILAIFLMARKGFVYTISMDIYAFRLAFSSILPCIQHQNALHLAPKLTAFSTKTHCVQRHIARHLAAKRTTFCSKQPKIWCKWRFFEINIHFALCTSYPRFASKQTFARIDYLRQGVRLVNGKATHNVKICTKNCTNSGDVCIILMLAKDIKGIRNKA